MYGNKTFLLFLSKLLIIGIAFGSLEKCYQPQHDAKIDEETIQSYYKIGRQECLSFLKDQSKINLLKTTKIQQYLENWKDNGPKKQCRGNDLLYQLTNQLPWIFGPKNCSTHSSCWMGILTCNTEGDVNPLPKITANTPDFQKRVLDYLKQSGLSSSRWATLTYSGWSIKSLDVQMRLVGTEIIATDTSVVKIRDSRESVIIGRYFVTIPGQYKFEAKLVDIYPMKLFNWTSNERARGWDMWFPVYLGGNEPRCRPYMSCSVPRDCCGCFEKAAIFPTSNPITITDGYHKCLKSLSPTYQRLLTQPLPYCTLGNHSGRWLTVPSSIMNICTPTYKLPTAGMQNVHTSLSPTEIWSNISNYSHSQRTKKTKPEKIHLMELNRYSGHSQGDICHLFYTGIDKPEHDSRLEIFAPYECQYRLYSKKETHDCLVKNNRTKTFFHGDSQIRDLTNFISNSLGFSELTTEQMKQMTNFEGVKNLGFGDKDINFAFTYGIDHKDFDVGLVELDEAPQPYSAYITNFALTHNLYNTSDFPLFIQSIKSSTMYNYWKKRASSSTPSSQLKIFHSSNHISTLLSFTGGHGQIIRLVDQQLSQIFLNEFHFHHFDMYEITRGKYDYFDGLHYRGIPARMGTIIFINMLCNL